MIICKEKSRFDIEAAWKKTEFSLFMNNLYACREWPYKNIKTAIIAYEFIDDHSDKELKD